jgi:hypothetical protein
MQSDLFDYHDITRQPLTPLYDVFSAVAVRRGVDSDSGRPVWIHRARTETYNDLASNSLDFLRVIRSESQAKLNGSQHIFPKLYDSFVDHGKQAIVTRRYPGYYTIEEILREYPDGVDGPTLAWMANRMFEAIIVLGLIHVANGALLPPYVRFYFGTEMDKQRHTIRIDEWSVAARVPNEGVYPRLVGKFSGYDSFYPPELPDQLTHVTDLAMGARCMLHLADANLPRPMRHLLKMAAADNAAARPSDVLSFMEQFRSMQERNFGTAKFHFTPMPRGAGRTQ